MGETTTLAKKPRETTTFERLANLLPKTETHWRAIASRAHRLRSYPGDEAAARTHELQIWEIRQGLLPGTSRQMRLCPRCLKRGVKYALLFIGGMDRCGTCDWPGPNRLESGDSASPA